MRKTLNLIALVMLVSVNVLTPISYAQEESESLEPSNGVTKIITYDADNGVIKFKYDEDEIRIKDKNVGAENPTMAPEAYQLMQLVKQMCSRVFSEEELESPAPINYVCEPEFATMATDIADEEINNYHDAMNYISSHYDNSSNAYGDYYRWGNSTGYANYDELACQENDEYLGVESLYNDCFLNVASGAVERGFMDGYDGNNYGWYQGNYDNPCDVSKGEYLPSPSDREQLIDMWGYINEVSTEVEEKSLYKKRISGGYADQFMSDLMVPHAGYVGILLSPKAASTVNGDPLGYEDYYDSLWTAYGYDSDYNRTAGTISMNGDNGVQYYDGINLLATPVRCFVATDPVTLTFKFNNGQPDKVLKIQRGNRLGEPEEYYPQKDGSVFDGWYVGDEEYYFEENIEQNLTIEARWTKCKDGQVVKNNKCVYEVEHDVDRGLLKVTDGERTVYIKDKNVGAKVSAGLNNAEKIEIILKNMCNYYDGMMRGKSIEGNEGEYRNCSVKAYEEVAELLNVSKEIVNDDYISDYLYNYYNSEEYLDYIQSFGNYYYRGNDDKYDTFKCELVPSDEDSTSESLQTSSIYPICGIDSDGSGNLNNTGWNGSVGANNPCNGAGEYMPTLEDWAEVMDIWTTNNISNEYVFKDELAKRESEVYYSSISYWYAPYFQEDLLIPSAGSIVNNCNILNEDATVSEAPVSEISLPCLGNYMGAYLWSSRNENNVFGSLYHENYNGWSIYTSPEDNISVPVRCFVDIDALTHTITFDTVGGTPVASIAQEDNTTIETAPKTTKAGYTFDGWYDGNEKVSFPYLVLGDKTLVAHWIENKSSNGYGGGGSSSSKSKIEQVDKQHNSADEKKTEPEIKKDEGKNIKIITNAPVNTEKETFNAHQWAYSKGLTKYRTSSEARMDDPLNRSEMAKIVTIFATEFLDKVPDEKKKEFCSQYSDMWKVEDDMKLFISKSCELGYMGYESNGVDALERFRPYTPLTVAEVSTILSRMVRGNENAMNGKDWYKGHLYASYNYGLMDDIKDPKRNITRKEAYVMLYRLSGMID